MKMKKRSTQVGVVISFIVFIMFLYFLLILIRPAFKTAHTVREPFLDYLKFSLQEMFVSNLTTMAIYVNIQSQQTCVSLKNIVKPIEEYGMKINQLIIKNEAGEILDYSVRGENDLWVKTGKKYEGYLKIYYSEETSSSYCSLNPAQCGILGCSPRGDDYQIHIVSINSEVFEQKIHSFIEKYSTDYETLKKELKLPYGTEFEFSIVFENSEGHVIEASQPLPADREVYVEEIPIRYLDEWGTIKYGVLTLKIWDSY